jgi:hypothetical protein
MSHYLLRYRVQTCLSKDKDVDITYSGHTVGFLFSKKRAQESSVIAQLEIDAKDSREAHLKAAASIIPQALDALSFSTGTPLLLEHCELVLKDEAGTKARKVIFIGKRSTPASVKLGDESISDAQKLLDSAGLQSVPLCWYRYAQLRQLTMDRFLFQWLTFEELAGDTDIVIECRNCGHPRSHRGSNRHRAFELFKAADPTIEVGDFNEKIWGRIRNLVFHGGKYPAPAFLAELVPITETLRRACELEIIRQEQLPSRNRAPKPLDQVYYVHLFIEWQTKDPSVAYAQDFPSAALSKMVEEGAPGVVGMNFPEASGFSVLEFEADSRTW